MSRRELRRVDADFRRRRLATGSKQLALREINRSFGLLDVTSEELGGCVETHHRRLNHGRMFLEMSEV
jgi:hypothetical protein